MAMAFGNETLNRVFVEYLKPASEAAGFRLVRIDEGPSAGLIDVRLQNEIRTSRFLVADLTDRNPGAYWEAGFAHGLGLPVIYTCEADAFEKKGTHFDTNHFHTIKWDAGNPAEAASRLRDTIRATLPEEAKLGDAQ
jgi:nucleoside 2-deoxyribosyltransferase